MDFTARRRKRSANITPIKPARIYPSKAISKDKSYNGVSAGRAFKTPKEAIIAKSKEQTKGVNEILNPLERLKNNVQDSQKSRLPPPPFVEVGNQTYKVLPVFLGDNFGIPFIRIINMADNYIFAILVVIRNSTKTVCSFEIWEASAPATIPL